MKKYISCLLVLLALVLPMLVMEAQAATTGTCGENVTWSLDDAGILTISGTGDMADYASASDVPWYASRASVKSVVIKDGVTTIGDRAFYNCAGLTDVTVGSGVKTVGTFAFQGCSALGEIVLPAAVTALEDSAFRGCTALETMTFDGNAPALGSYVFRDGASDMTVRYYEGSTGFDAAPWTDYYHETMHVGQWVVDTEPGCTTDGSKHIDCTYCETTITETIPSRHDYVDGVCSVCQGIQLLDSGSCGSNLTWELDIRGVLTISGTGSMRDYSWFNVPWSEHAENIISVIIEEGVTSIGNYAFYNCSSLESVTIPDSVTTIGEDAFYSCSSLKSVTIPDSVTTIGEDAFYSCSSLASVTIPDSVTTIDSSAFSGCSSLTDVYITDIAAWLSISFEYYDDNPLCVNDLSKKLYLNGNLVTNLVIPEGITTIAESAFENCSSLKSVTIPDSVTEIGSCAFYNCSSLKSVTIPDSVTEIGSSAFAYCSSLESVTIPDSVIIIGDGAFYSCSSLKSVTIPDSVTEIGSGAFYGCSSLESVTIGDSVTKIGSNAFSGCSSLASVTIPDSVTEIGSWAFYNCSSLESITIGDSVTKIGSNAFSGCSSLASVTIPDSVTEIGYRAFYGCSSLADVYITDVAAWLDIFFEYESLYYDGDKANPMRANDLDKKLYLNDKLITNLVIPEGVTEIGNLAFYNCSSLESVTIPDSVTEINESAFSGCSSLTDIYYGGTEEQWDALDCWTEADWIHYGCTTAEGHWTSKGMTMVCSCGYTQGSIGNPENQLHLAGYVGQTFAVEVTSGSNYDYELTGENSDYVSVSLSGISTMVTGSGTVYGKEYTLTFSQPGHYELAFEQDWTGNTFCFSADIYAKDNSFEDVAEDAYYFGPVLWAVNEGITNGMSENSFAPEATCTRGQIVTFLWRACGSPEPESSSNPFWDVSSSDYFYKAVLWAVENGITSGMGDGSFAPGAPCTRGQVATFLWRACGQPAPGGTNIFTDIAPGAYYYDAVLWAVENGITNGMGDGTFAPDAPCTRGQIVTFLYRAMQ